MIKHDEQLYLDMFGNLLADKRQEGGIGPAMIYKNFSRQMYARLLMKTNNKKCGLSVLYHTTDLNLNIAGSSNVNNYFIYYLLLPFIKHSGNIIFSYIGYGSEHMFCFFFYYLTEPEHRKLG